MIDLYPPQKTFLGSILLSHPSLNDPHFFHSVILISSYDERNGSVGLIINKPLGKNLGNIDSSLLGEALGNVPLFIGGPVSPKQITIVGWKWSPQEQEVRFYFGLSVEKARALLKVEPNIEIRAFLGYSKWVIGQLEQEIQSNNWIFSSINSIILGSVPIDELWHSMVVNEKPEFDLFYPPTDPSLN